MTHKSTRLHLIKVAHSSVKEQPISLFLHLSFHRRAGTTRHLYDLITLQTHCSARLVGIMQTNKTFTAAETARLPDGVYTRRCTRGCGKTAYNCIDRQVLASSKPRPECCNMSQWKKEAAGCCRHEGSPKKMAARLRPPEPGRRQCVYLPAAPRTRCEQKIALPSGATGSANEHAS